MEKAIKCYRRFHGYDYTRGVRLFLTTSLAPRRPVLGRVEWLEGGSSARQARVALTPAGEAVEAALVETPCFVPGVSLERHVVMPDHVHLLEAKLCAVRVSRRVERLPASVAERFLRGAAKGWVYRPGIHDAPLLAEGRLAVLGLGGAGRQEVTRAGSLLLNDKIAAMAEASGGLALRLGADGAMLEDGSRRKRIMSKTCTIWLTYASFSGRQSSEQPGGTKQ